MNYDNMKKLVAKVQANVCLAGVAGAAPTRRSDPGR